MEIYTNEEQQVEAIKGWWKENGTSVIAGTVIGLAGLFGWRWYNDHQQTNMQLASSEFSRVTDAMTKEGDKAFAQVEGFINDNKGAYADLASLELASAAVKAGKLDVAAAQLTRVAEQGDASVQAIAAVRLARVLAEQGKADDALARLAKIQDAAFKAQVAEVRGDILLAQNKPEEARSAYQAAADAGGLQSSAELRLKMDDLALPAVAVDEKPDA
ncbi:YfgM family protein [Aeromonas simiae]|uniref:YfgM family protein n=1 Tax=Aeromonas simiae TaxID=218936 RepID=UPI0005A66FE8|nr:tetratricopeptide repeat protein [Aeromonas simiae]MDO2951085.1 tetratricopeptide repeat protein [Aeromonas simiae]